MSADKSDSETERVTDRHGTNVPPELDGVDLWNASECPNCGDSENAWIQNPAGYYTCPTCWSTWAGDAEDASIVDYVSTGRVSDMSETATKCRMGGCERDATDEVDGRFCSVECRATREKREADAREARLDDIAQAEAEAERKGF